MLAILLLFFPALVALVLRQQLVTRTPGQPVLVTTPHLAPGRLLEYAMWVLLINGLLLGLSSLWDTQNLAKQLQSSLSNLSLALAGRYMIYALLLALLLPLAQQRLVKIYTQRQLARLGQEVTLTAQAALRQLRAYYRCPQLRAQVARYARAALYLYAAALFLINLTRCFDNVFWGDEAFSILWARDSPANIITKTAQVEPHLPAYYLYLQLFMRWIAPWCGGDPHLATLLTYDVILILGTTWVRQRLGTGCAALFLTLTSFLTHAVQYNLEVRMYSLSAMMLLGSFIALFELLRTNRWRAWLLFAVLSLGAAYTHYYAVVAVAFTYLSLLLYIWLHSRAPLSLLFARLATDQLWAKFCTASALTGAGFLPWLMIMFTMWRKRLGTPFWINRYQSWESCLNYLFAGPLASQLKILFFVVTLLVIIIESGWIRGRGQLPPAYAAATDKPAPATPRLLLRFQRGHLTPLTIWLLVGLVTILGTIATGLAVSLITRPLFELRYIFPITIIAWLLLVGAMARVKHGNGLALVLALIVVWYHFPTFVNNYTREKRLKLSTENILLKTAAINDKSCIITNIGHINWTVADYYYPQTPHAYETDYLVALNNSKYGPDRWLFWKGDRFNNDQLNKIRQAGYTVQFICEDILGGNYKINIYHLTRTPPS